MVRISGNYQDKADVHSFQKTEGILAFRKDEAVLEEEVSVGDKISFYSLPNGQFFVSKDSDGVAISKISSAYIFLDVELNVEEK